MIRWIIFNKLKPGCINTGQASLISLVPGTLIYISDFTILLADALSLEATDKTL